VSEEGAITTGLWNSLSSFLGTGSFDHANKDTCWTSFHDSGISLANDHKTLITRVKERYSESLNVLGEDLPDTGLLVKPAAGFGYGIPKLHSALQNDLRGLEFKRLLFLVSSDLPSDDQRAVSFLRTHDNKFANAFPLAFPQDIFLGSGSPSSPLRSRESSDFQFLYLDHMSEQGPAQAGARYLLFSTATVMALLQRQAFQVIISARTMTVYCAQQCRQLWTRGSHQRARTSTTRATGLSNIASTPVPATSTKKLLSTPRR